MNNFLKIAFTPKNLTKVEHILDRVKDEVYLDKDTYKCMHLSLTEAITNAFVHGNNEDAGKNVIVLIDKSKDSISFTVKDEGDGFDYIDLPDPLSPEQVEKPGGRGVFLMKQLCHKVEYRDCGSTVKMTFKL